MPERPRPDYASREADDLAYLFDYFGEEECPQLDAHLYRALCQGVKQDAELLAIAAHAPPQQPPPNLLFAAVHYLLLGGASHALRDWYPELSDGPAQTPATAFAPFRDFCLEHRESIESLIETRLTQTNVLQRCSGLLPAFATAFSAGGDRPLALVEIGSSAGLNLQWDRFRYCYDDGTSWGDPGSRVRIDCELRGDGPLPAPSPALLPPLPETIPVAWRRGVDIHPIDIRDPDRVQWLRALVWPDHPGRQERITAAIEIARAERPEVVRGDAALELPSLLEAAPPDATLCVYGTHTLYQFPRDALIATFKAMEAASLRRDIHFFGIEGTGDRCSELQATRYRRGDRETRLAARCNPHGRWLEWLAS